MKIANTVLASILLAAIGCSQSQTTNDKLITVDVTAKYPLKELILQDFMDVEYIPLETTDEFITAANIQAIGKDIIIFKNRGRTDGSIFIFDRKGKGIRKINRLGQGGEEYTNVLNVTLDEDKGEIYINNHYSSKIAVYDLFGNYKRSFKQRDNFFYDYIGNFNQDYLICHDGFLEYDKPNEKRNFFMLVSKQDGSIKEIPIPYKEPKSTIIIERDMNGEITNDWGIRNKQLIPFQSNWILIEPSADTIYCYSQNQELKPLIVRTPSIESVNPEIFLFPNVFTDRYYFMQTVKKKINFGIDKDVPRTDLVYDKNENAIFECIVYNDDFTDKQPVNLMFEMFMLSIVNNNEIAFMKNLEAFELVDAHKKGRLKGKLKEIASTLDEESNGVIMLLSIRNKNISNDR